MNVVRWAIVLLLGESATAVITGHVRALDSASPADDDDLEAIADELKRWWAGPPATGFVEASRFYLNTAKLSEVTTQRVEPDLSDVYSLDGDEIAGGAFDTYLPGPKTPLDNVYYAREPQLAWCVSLRTPIESRRSRGRIFFPAGAGFAIQGGDTIDHLDQQAGVLTETEREEVTALIQGLALRIRAAVLDGDDPRWNLAVYSRRFREVHTVTAFKGHRTVRTIRERQGVQDYFEIDLVPPEP